MPEPCPKKIRVILAALAVPSYRLAAGAGITRSKFSRYLNGGAKLGPSECGRIAGALRELITEEALK